MLIVLLLTCRGIIVTNLHWSRIPNHTKIPKLNSNSGMGFHVSNFECIVKSEWKSFHFSSLNNYFLCRSHQLTLKIKMYPLTIVINGKFILFFKMFNVFEGLMEMVLMLLKNTRIVSNPIIVMAVCFAPFANDIKNRLKSVWKSRLG